MFSFFTKNEFLVDHLEGFIDIHNHILPGIDDGAKNLEESIELIKGFGEFGVRDFLCTPHIMENYYPNTPEKIHSALTIVQNSLKKNNLENANITAAAEHMIDAGFENLLNSNSIMPLAERYLLIEMSYLQPSINFDESSKKISERGFSPILAHPERYSYLKKSSSKYHSYKQKGILFQLNLLSIGNYYGPEVHKKAIKLIHDGLIDFLASDVHNTQQLITLKTITVDKKIKNLLMPLIVKTIESFNL